MSTFRLTVLGLLLALGCAGCSKDKPAQTAAVQPNSTETAPASGTVPPKADKTTLLQPEYPAEARAKGQQGVVQLNLHVLSNGVVDDANILKSSGFPQLDEYAVRGARLWRMTPGTVDGKPTTMWHPFRVTYKLD